MKETLWTAEGRCELLRSLGVEGLRQAVTTVNGEELRRYREKSIVLMTEGGRRYFLKRYHYSRLSVFFRAALKWNFPVFSGHVERSRLEQLRALGFRVPVVLASGEGGTWSTGMAFILLEELAGRSLEECLAAGDFDVRFLRRLARDLGRWAKRFHEAGFCHKDFYLCHIFFDEQAGLGLLDCERVTHWSGGLPRRWLIKDLAALYYSSLGKLPSSVWKAFVLAYFGSRENFERSGLGPAIVIKARRLSKRGRKL